MLFTKIVNEARTVIPGLAPPKSLSGPYFQNVIDTYITNMDVDSLVFKLYPWCIGQSKEPAFLSALFYFAICLVSLVSLACTSLITITAVKVRSLVATDKIFDVDVEIEIVHADIVVQ